MKQLKKSILALLTSALITSTFAVTSAQAISRPENLSINDITHLQMGLCGLVELDAETIKTFDVNGDGEITIKEVSYWQRVLAGYIDPENEPTTLSLNVTNATMGIGETFKLTGTTDVSEAKVSYLSSDSNIATVSSNGTVTAKASGSIIITASTENGLKETCKVTVKKMATSVTLNKTAITLGVGETFDLNETIPSDTAAYNRDYYTNNSAIATVQKSGGLIKAVASGTTTVYVKLSNGKTASCTVTVKNMATSVTLNKTAITLGVGETFDLNETIPSGTAAYYRDYYTNNSAIATVQKSGGLIKAVAPGSTTVYVKLNNGKTASCTVTVKAMATSVTLNKTSITLGVGETFDFNSSIPSGTAAYYRYFYTNNSAIATIEKRGGLMKAVAPGSTTIYVKLNNGKTATCTVTVKAMATSVTLNAKSLNLEIGNTYTLKATIPSGTAAYYKTFSSSNTNVATVSSSGVVTAKNAGTAKITVKLNNGASATCTVYVKKSLDATEREMEALINQYRQSLGLKPLTVTVGLQEAADIRAEEICQYFSHTRPNGTNCFSVLKELGISYKKSGECLAGYYSDPATTLTQWKNSSGHNNIITDPDFTHMATGCYEEDGYYYWVFFAIKA